MPPDFLLHRFRRTAAVQRDHRIPAGLVRSSEILDKARHFDAFFVGNVRTPGEQFREPARSGRIVILIRPRQGHDQPARNLVGDPVHIVNLGGQ